MPKHFPGRLLSLSMVWLISFWVMEEGTHRVRRAGALAVDICYESYSRLNI